MTEDNKLLPRTIRFVEWIAFLMMVLPSFTFAEGLLFAISQREAMITPPTSSVSGSLVEIQGYLKSGRFREAQTKARDVITARPEAVMAWTYLGMASVRLDEPLQAIDAYEHAIALGTHDPRPYLDLGIL